MSFNNYVQALKFKHESLKRKIKDSYFNSKDDTEVRKLKKQKLLLKEKIVNLSSAKQGLS